MNEVSTLRNEASSRASALILYLKFQTNLTRKDIRGIAFKEAESTIRQLGLLYDDFDLTPDQVQLLAHKATIFAMRSSY